jgi:hypothetical protein
MAIPGLTDNLTLWLRGRAVLAAHGDAVPDWYDLADGGAADFSQGTPGLEPLMVHDAKNRRPALSFDGVAQYMTGPAMGGLFTTTAKTLFVAFNALSVGANGAIFGDTASRFGIYVQAGPTLVIYHFDGAGKSVSFDTTEGFSLGEMHVLGVVHNGTKMYCCLDSVDNEKEVATGATGSVAATLRLGRSGAGNYQECLIGEIRAHNAIFNPTVADNSQFHAGMAYMLSEYGDRGDPLAMAQDRVARGLWIRSAPQDQAKVALPASGVDHVVGTVLGIADDGLPMPTGISPEVRATEPWRNDAMVVTEQTISFADEKGGQ